MAATKIPFKARLLQELVEKSDKPIKLERWAYAAIYGREALRAASLTARSKSQAGMTCSLATKLPKQKPSATAPKATIPSLRLNG